jgi:acetyl-CoA carboxylase biotin carboxyl carrier protein
MNALDRFRELSAWLAATDIALLELRGPDTLIRLRRGGNGVAAAPPEDPAHRSPGATPRERGDDDPASQPGCENAAVTVVRAPCVGILRHGHPLHDAPLAAAGRHVVAGQPLALLQIGHTLVPALAPRDGVVARLVARDGDAVGFGDPLVELLD